MTGYQVEPQPGNRDPAPGGLALLQSFVNSRWDLERDHEDKFASPAQLAEWLADRGLLKPSVSLTGADLKRALDVRDGLQALLFVNNGAAPDHHAIGRLNAALDRPALSVRLGAHAPPTFAAERRFAGALAAIASIAAVAQLDGSWARLKACRGADCGWVFYDHSRNRSGSWCSMSTCGARAKARHYRQRRRRAPRSRP